MKINGRNSRTTFAIAALAVAIFTTACPVRPTQLVGQTLVAAQPIVVQQQPSPIVVRQPTPVVMQQPPMVVQPPVVVQQPPMVVRRPPVYVSPSVVYPGQVSSGMVRYSGERVRYGFTIGSYRSVSIYVDGHGLDPTVSLYDAYSNRLAYNDDGGSGLDSHIVRTLGPGSYVVEVAGYSSSTGTYTLRIN